MTIAIVTDSGSDLPSDLINSLKIKIVPIHIYFGNTLYRDNIDINADQLYQKLVTSPVHPTTTQPMPVEFADVYTELSKNYSEIVSIHLSSKVSGTFNSALQGKQMVKTQSKIEVVDSYTLSTGLGLIVLAAARIAAAGGGLSNVMEEIGNAIKNIKIFGVLDTLKYLLAGGRITKTKAIIGGLLNVKPILTMNKGEIVQYGMARSYSKGMEKLYEIISKFHDIKELAVVHSTVPEEAKKLGEKFENILPKEKIIMARLGAGLGVHGGPGTLFVAFRHG